MPEAHNDETPAAPIEADTAQFVSPNEDSSAETTPIHDEAKEAARQYLEGADKADISRRREDDDPTQFAGDFVEED